MDRVGKLHLFVAIDRTSQLAFVGPNERATTWISADFLGRLLAAALYEAHTMLIENGVHFTTSGAGGSAVPLIREAVARCELFRVRAFEHACAKAHIDHRMTRPKHPWSYGQVECLNPTIKEATVKRFHYDDHEQLRCHLTDLVSLCNFGRHLKTLERLTLYEFICTGGRPSRSVSTLLRSTKCRD